MYSSRAGIYLNSQGDFGLKRCIIIIIITIKEEEVYLVYIVFLCIHVNVIIYKYASEKVFNF